MDSILKQRINSSLILSEIIVVDSGSTDNSQNILEKYQDRIKIILSPTNSMSPLSPAEARNLGVSHSKGDILFFTDSDCVPEESWILKMANSFLEFDADCVIGNREPDIGDGFGTFMRRYDFILYSEKFTTRTQVLFTKQTILQGGPFILLAANNLALRKTFWETVGGMKSIFRHPAGEDIMLEIELLMHGCRIVFNPTASVLHIHPIALGHLLRRAAHNGEATCLLGRYSPSIHQLASFRKARS